MNYFTTILNMLVVVNLYFISRSDIIFNCFHIKIFLHQFVCFYNYFAIYMPIVDQYRGKTLLITGTTGFLGKVLLEKFLFSLP